MIDQDLRRDYERLSTALEPPRDVSTRVAGRIRQRRRRRAVGVAAAMALIAAIGVGGALAAMGDRGGIVAGVPSERPVPSEKPEPNAPPPEKVTCSDGADPEVTGYDHGGYPTFDELLADWQSRGEYVIDKDKQTIFFVREDGTAWSALTWMGDDESGWYPNSFTVCPE